MSQIVTFKATDVEINSRTGFIGFANDATGQYFWIQPGETSTGLSSAKDEIWLERDDQQFGGSGGNWRIVLTRNSFAADTRMLPWMACDRVEIDFEVDDSRFESLKELLKRVMVGCPVDLIIAE